MPDASASPTSPAAFVARVYPTLDARSYYELLGVAPTADVGAIRAAFYRLAAQLHPDRYFTLPDQETRAKLETIYARVSEAYRVLASAERRSAYDRALASGKKRLPLGAPEPNAAAKNPEDALRHPEAKKFFRLGMVCLGRRDFKGALLNFGFARSFEPSSPQIAERIAEAEAGARGGPRRG